MGLKSCLYSTQTFFSQSGPAHSPELIFHIIDVCPKTHLSPYLWCKCYGMLDYKMSCLSLILKFRLCYWKFSIMFLVMIFSSFVRDVFSFSLVFRKWKKKSLPYKAVIDYMFMLLVGYAPTKLVQLSFLDTIQDFFVSWTWNCTCI